MNHCKRINKLITERYGLIALDNKPKFRLIWSEDIFEKHQGTFDNVTDSGIYLGTETGIKNGHKYNYFRERFVLEIHYRTMLDLMGIRATNPDEIVDWDGYEPMFVYNEKGTGNYFRPEWSDICFVIDRFLQHIKLKEPKVKSEANFASDEAEMLRKSHKETREIIQGDDTDILDAVRHGEGVFMPNKVFGENNV